ncbi:glucose-6-phosphate isomerase family protein [Caproiciproducens sp. CPB-2]|nr:glucose-6-phosphate isomerase family protein [Caproiciproducens sp. CPB-2]MDF1493151.1 glucose-6-phosphate isomerase family protein [Caproiciproducens sp. CPB-2]
MFYPGFDVKPDIGSLDFSYGEGVFGPVTEKRRLDDIRRSLSDPSASGPEVVYSVAMDVGKTRDQDDLRARNLLYGAMIYAKGRVGDEPVRSQGHVHAVSPSCGSSTPEVYEIWSGEAVIFMQESDGDDAGECYAVRAGEGEVVIVPEGWVHCTVNADPTREMTFGAWCVRDYGFDYEHLDCHLVRHHRVGGWGNRPLRCRTAASGRENGQVHREMGTCPRAEKRGCGTGGRLV